MPPGQSPGPSHFPNSQAALPWFGGNLKAGRRDCRHGNHHLRAWHGPEAPAGPGASPTATDIDEAPALRDRRWSLRGGLRGRQGEPAWVRPALLAVLALTAVLYLWDLGASGWANSFYAAAVQAGTKSWKAFFFGSFDSSNFITVDKPPASLWVMELSGPHLRPQLLEHPGAPGARGSGHRGPPLPRASGAGSRPRPACWRAVVMALTPVATLMFRFNNPDALLVLLLVGGAVRHHPAPSTAAGPAGWSLAGALVGFGFIDQDAAGVHRACPSSACVYLLAGPPKLGRGSCQLVWCGVALVVSAGWWVAAVELTPAADRPYIGGSQDNSISQPHLRLQRLRPAHRQRERQRRRRAAGPQRATVGPTGSDRPLQRPRWAARSRG